MKKLLGTILFVIAGIVSFAQFSVSHYNTARLQRQQYAYDQMIAPADVVWSAVQTTYGLGGPTKDTGLSSPALQDKDDIQGFKGIGNAVPSIANLLFTNTPPAKSGNPVWNNGLNPNSTLNSAYLVNRDNIFAANGQNLFDRWAQWNNSTIGNSNFETNPGSLSTITHPIDVIIGLRYTNKVAYETNTFFKDNAPNGIQVNVTSGSLNTTTQYDQWQDQLIRFKIDASGNWTIWKNGVSIGSGTLASLSTTELYWGTNSHVMQSHNRFIMYKFGATSFDNTINSIYYNAQICWPWTKPSYPFVTNLWQGGFNSFAGAGNTVYTPGNNQTTTFSGGTGIRGADYVQYFYYDKLDATLFPGGDAPYATSRMVPAVVDISNITTGNSVSQITMDGTNLLSSAVSFTTDAATTATNLASAINSGPASSSWFAYVKNSTAVQIHKKIFTIAPDVISVSSTGFTPTSIIQIPHGSTFDTATHNVVGGIYNGNFSNGNIGISAMFYVSDNTGFRGEPIPTDWTYKNW